MWLVTPVKNGHQETLFKPSVCSSTGQKMKKAILKRHEVVSSNVSYTKELLFPRNLAPEHDFVSECVCLVKSIFNHTVAYGLPRTCQSTVVFNMLGAC